MPIDGSIGTTDLLEREMTPRLTCNTGGALSGRCWSPGVASWYSVSASEHCWEGLPPAVSIAALVFAEKRARTPETAAATVGKNLTPRGTRHRTRGAWRCQAMSSPRPQIEETGKRGKPGEGNNKKGAALSRGALHADGAREGT
jgi:hypothetical protein